MDKSSEIFLEQILFDHISDFLRFRFGVVAMNRNDVKIQSQEEIKLKRHLKNSHELLHRSLLQNEMITLKISVLVSAKAHIKPRDEFTSCVSEAMNSVSFTKNVPTRRKFFEKAVVSTEWKEQIYEQVQINNFSRIEDAKDSTKPFIAPIIGAIGGLVLLSVGLLTVYQIKRKAFPLKEFDEVHSVSNKKKSERRNYDGDDVENNTDDNDMSLQVPKFFQLIEGQHSPSMLAECLRSSSITSSDKEIEHDGENDKNDDTPDTELKNPLVPPSPTDSSYFGIPPMIVIDNIEPELEGSHSTNPTCPKSESDQNSDDSIEDRKTKGIKVKHIEASSALAAALHVRDNSESSKKYNLLK